MQFYALARWAWDHLIAYHYPAAFGKGGKLLYRSEMPVGQKQF